MTRQMAQAIIAEASKDQRITATLNTTYVRSGHKGGYRVHLLLRKFQTQMVAANQTDWQMIRELWCGL